MDISALPGVAKLNFKLAKQSSTIVTNLPLWQRRNPLNPAEIWALDNAGVVYKSANSGASWAVVSGNTISASAGQGLAIFKDYLFVARKTAIDVYGPLSISPSWTNAFLAIDSDDTWHPMLPSKLDGKLYGGAGRFIFSVEEVLGQVFDPGNSATYVFTAQALDLPPNKRIKTFYEQGDDLVSGTWMGSAITDFKSATLYPWDRSSPSFGQPIELEENGINAAICVENVAYIVAGIGGAVYQCNGYQAALIAKVPEYVTQIDGGGFLLPLPDAIMYHKGKIYFGVGGSLNLDGGGIWSLDISTKRNVLNYENIISTGSTANTSGLLIGSLLSLTREVFQVGWEDFPNSGIDLISTSSRVASSYGGKIESAAYEVGSNLIKKQFQRIEFLLSSVLLTGQGVKLEYRIDLASAWVLIGTYDFAAIGAVRSHSAKTNIPACEIIQIRASVTVGTATSKSPELKSVTLF